MAAPRAGGAPRINQNGKQAAKEDIEDDFGDTDVASMLV